MPYVSLDSNGNITAVYACQQSDATPFLADTDPKLVAYLAGPTVPQTVTMLQARLALQQAGLTTQVQNAVTADTTGVLAIWWEYAPTVQRQNPQLLQVATTLNMTSAQIDALFTAAAAIQT